MKTQNSPNWLLSPFLVSWCFIYAYLHPRGAKHSPCIVALGWPSADFLDFRHDLKSRPLTLYNSALWPVLMKRKKRLLKNISKNTPSWFQSNRWPFTPEVFARKSFYKGAKMSKNEKFKKCTKFTSESISGELMVHICLPASTWCEALSLHSCLRVAFGWFFRFLTWPSKSAFDAL